MEDLFYYSNHCKHSQRVIQYISKNNLIDKISCICIDKRSRDKQNNHLIIHLENGQTFTMPPSIQSVPAILRKSQNHTVVLGAEQIISYIQSQSKYTNMQQRQSTILNNNIEPISFEFMGSQSNNNILSDKFTDYNTHHEVLSAKGNGKERPLHHYVGVDNNQIINTPADSYQADKLPTSITVESLSQKRDLDITI
jgi:hypothetical protein